MVVVTNGQDVQDANMSRAVIQNEIRLVRNQSEYWLWILKADGFDFCDKRSGSNQTAPADGAPDGFGPMQDDDVPF